MSSQNLTIVQAVRDGLYTEMNLDDEVLVMGEDVGKNGGVFRATEGLWDEFGDDRVIDTPLAESGIVGTAIGMAAMGLKPVPEIQFSGFMYPGFDQIVSHMGRFRNRTRGRYTLPMVLRAPYGGGIRAPESHSESKEMFYAHEAGLKVVIPSTPYDTKGLLISAIRDPTRSSSWSRSSSTGRSAARSRKTTTRSPSARPRFAARARTCPCSPSAR